jgi:hypothetical protein
MSDHRIVSPLRALAPGQIDAQVLPWTLEITLERVMSLTRIAGCATAGAVCGFGILSSAAANPPVAREKTAPSSVAGPHPESSSTPRLDLRPPMDYSSAPGDAPDRAHSPAFGLHRADSSPGEGRTPSPPLVTDDPNFRMMSRSAIFLGRLRREGIPFARLWESKSALLSIGLNRKGKPGIWLTQKTR